MFETCRTPYHSCTEYVCTRLFIQELIAHDTAVMASADWTKEQAYLAEQMEAKRAAKHAELIGFCGTAYPAEAEGVQCI